MKKLESLKIFKIEELSKNSMSSIRGGYSTTRTETSGGSICVSDLGSGLTSTNTECVAYDADFTLTSETGTSTFYINTHDTGQSC